MPQPDIRLYALDTGLIECHDYAMFSPNAGPGVRQDMTVCSYLVVHPKAVLLFDTGISDAIAALPGGQKIMDTITFHVPRTLQGQLAELGYSPDDVDILALSHLHIDHVGNVGLFKKATVLLQQAEVDAAYGPDAEALSYIPATYADVETGHIQPVSGNHDVFGDGSVKLISLPGHTPGHQGLLVRLANSGPILLGSDITYSAEDYLNEVPRASNYDLEQTRLSIATAKRLARDEDATVWLHHDLEAQRTVRLAPQYYD